MCSALSKPFLVSSAQIPYKELKDTLESSLKESLVVFLYTHTLFNYYILFVSCVCAHGCMSATQCVGVRRQPSETDYCLLCGSRKSNSGCLPWWQASPFTHWASPWASFHIYIPVFSCGTRKIQQPLTLVAQEFSVQPAGQAISMKFLCFH